MFQTSLLNYASAVFHWSALLRSRYRLMKRNNELLVVFCPSDSVMIPVKPPSLPKNVRLGARIDRQIIR